MRTLALVSIALVVGSGVAQADPLCPNWIPDDSEAGRSVHLERTLGDVSFYYGDPKAVAELAPEVGTDPSNVTKHWKFARRWGDKLTVVCHYHDMNKTIVGVVPLSITSCMLGTLVGYDGEIPGLLGLVCT